jgi:hypothetical protein
MKKLALKQETLRKLTTDELTKVAGGFATHRCTDLDSEACTEQGSHGCTNHGSAQCFRFGN